MEVARADLGEARMRAAEANEPVLRDNPSRWVILPIKYNSFWSFFKKHENEFWTAEDFSYSITPISLDDDTVEKIKRFILIDALCDIEIFGSGCVGTCELLEDIQVPEARAFFGFECAFDTICQEVLCSIANVFHSSLSLSNENSEILQLKKKWAKFTPTTFSERLLRHAIAKTIFACGRSLVARSLGGKLENYAAPAGRVLRTYQMHAAFAAHVHSFLDAAKLPVSFMQTLIEEAQDIEVRFLLAVLPLDAMQLDNDKVKAFVEGVGTSLKSAFCGLTPPRQILSGDYLPSIPPLEAYMKEMNQSTDSKTSTAPHTANISDNEDSKTNLNMDVDF